MRIVYVITYTFKNEMWRLLLQGLNDGSCNLVVNTSRFKVVLWRFHFKI